LTYTKKPCMEEIGESEQDSKNEENETEGLLPIGNRSIIERKRKTTQSTKDEEVGPETELLPISNKDRIE
jgi:hypothetical protein